MSFQGGGRTDKAGNRYETNYAILQLLRVIGEEICSIIIEATGDAEKGIDIWIVNKDGTQEGQQCKGRNQNKDSWTIGTINQYNILDTWKFQLERDNKNYVSIVSPISFVLLEDLISMAENSSGDAKDFYDNQILKSSKTMQNFYFDYCKGMKLDIENEIDKVKSLDYLKRTFYHQIPDFALKSLVKANIKYLFYENEDIVYSALLDFVINNNIWGKSIDLMKIKTYLDERDIKLSNLAFDNRIAPRIDTLNKEFDSFFIPINDKIVQREEYIQCKELINEGKSVIINGKAGYGKSGIVQLVVEECKKNNVPYIAIKLDKRVPEINTKEWGKHLGLPTSISYCLDSISKDRNAVIILDQLDALRWTQANSKDALFVCRELIEEVEDINKKRKNKISIILVCRSYDLNYDNNIKSLFKNEENNWNRIQVDKLSKEVVKEIVGKQYDNNSKKLNELLEIPSNLFIWTKLDKSKSYDNCYTTNRLIEEWWEQLLRKSSEVKIDNFLIRQCIDEIVKKMHRMSRISINKKFLNVDENALIYLSSNGFLFVEEQTVSFTHQRILDYFLEIEMINLYNDNKKIEEIIGKFEEQIPSRRYQVQMFLEDLLDINTTDFINVGKKLLDSENIRFYIKFVFFEVLGQIDNIDSEIENFIVEYYNNEKYGKYIIKNVIQSNIQYVEVLLNNGILDEWIKNDTKIDECITLLKSVSDKYNTKMVSFFEKYLFNSKEVDEKIYRCLNFDISNELDEIFELRIRLYEKYPELMEYYIDFKSLFKNNEMRAIKLIKLCIDYKTKNKNKSIYKYEEEIITEESEIIIKKDEEILKILLPSVPRETDTYWGEWTGRNKFNIGAERAAVNIIKKANSNLIKNSPEKFWSIYKEFMGKGYPIFNEIILDGLEKLTENYSDRIIDYLCDDIEKNIFDVSSGNGDELLLAKKILDKHSKSCSESCFEKIEQKIYYFYEKDSKEWYKRLREYNMNYMCDKMPWDWWGNLQVELIPFLSRERLNKKTKELLCVLHRRFKDGSCHFKYSNIHYGSVCSPIAKKKLSDKQWIKLLSNNKIKTKERSQWIETDGVFTESSLQEFAISFSNATSNEPKRMITIVLNNSNIILDAFIDALYSGMQANNSANEVSTDLLEELFKRFPYDNNEPRRARSICWIIESKKDFNWSNMTIKMLKDIAINHKNPTRINENDTNDEEKEMKSIQTLQSDSLNSVRGSAANAIANLLWKRKKLFEDFKETIEKLSKDENEAVRYASLNCLYHSYYINKEWSTPIILKLFEEDIRFVSFWESRKLLFSMYSDEKDRVIEIIKKSYYSTDKDIKKIGALCIAEMYIVNNEFADIMQDVKNMDEIQQETILRMIINYFNRLDYNEKCKDIVLRLNENECDLEGFISRNFYDNNIDLKRDKEFLIEIIKSNSGRRSIHALINYIEENALSILDFSEIIMGLLKSFVNCESDKEDLYYYSDELSKLVVALYDEVEGKSESEMGKIANECLDIWDKMYERQIGTIKLLSKEILDR